MALVQTKGEADYSIKPEAVTPALDTSEWPLLLKNYSKCEKYLCHLYRNLTDMAQYSFAPDTLLQFLMDVPPSSAT
jgi:hypothetical protein